MFVDFIIYSAKHNPPKIYKIYRRKYLFSIMMEFQNAYENDFYCFWKFEDLAVEKFW